MPATYSPPNFGNNSNENFFSYNTVTGLIDSDGTFYSRLREGTAQETTVKHEVSVKCNQKKDKGDLVIFL